MISRFLITLIRLYQRFISPMLGETCRFYPSCSEYAVMSLKKYGVIHGLFKAALRLIKCHPFHPGGIDYP